MKKNALERQIAEILPERSTPLVPSVLNQSSAEEGASLVRTKRDAKELARLKYNEKQKLKKAVTKARELQAVDEDAEFTTQIREVKERQKNIELLETLETRTLEPLDARNLSEYKVLSPADADRLMKLQGTTRTDALKILSDLNINLNVQLTKQDTSNLLACLLTCNETQLAALYKNPKTPIVIKTVIKRLQEDARLGSIATVEKLWDRVFGKGPMQLSLPEEVQTEKGIIPNTPISREAYIVIRDTLIR